MPIDRQSKRNLVKGEVQARATEHDASKSDSERLAARRKADFYAVLRKRLGGVADYAKEAQFEREYGTKRTQK